MTTNQGDPDPRIRTLGSIGPTISAAIAAHVATSDPHGDRAFATSADTAAIAAHNAASDPHGDRAVAAAALAAHVVATDPHGDRAYAAAQAAAAQSFAIATAEGYADIGDAAVEAYSSAYTDTELASHVAASDPHGDRAYTVSYVTTALGSYVPTSRTVSAGTGLTGGGALSSNLTFTVTYGTTAGTACQGNDSRLSDSRTPTAHATSHVTGGSDIIANAVASGNAGLLSGSDKAKLDGITSGATAYNDEAAQDAIGAMVADTATIDVTYTDATPELKWDVKANSISVSFMHASATDVLFGRSTAAAGAGEEIACNSAGRNLIAAADAQYLTGTLAAARLAANSLALSKVAQGTTRTLLGVVGAATADHADIALNFLAVSASVADVAITGTASPTTSFGQMHRCTGTSADYTVTLPALTGKAGQFMAFTIDPACTKLVTIAAAGGTQIADGAGTYTLWAGESLILRVTADETAWDVIANNRRMMRARCSNGAQSINASSQTLFNLAAADYDLGTLTDATNDVFTIRRAGKYAYSAYARLAAGSTAVRALLQVNRYPASHTGGVDIGTNEIPIPSTTLAGGFIVSGIFSFAAGDLCEASFFHNSAGARNIAWQFEIEEMPR